MHPAASVILFTTASGVGYGILALAPLLVAYGLLPDDNRWLGAALMLPALALVTLGLLSSTFHLGHPERAWRAVSQWRSSWLSREGIMAIVTYVPALAYAYAWIILGQTEGPWVWAGFATVITALCTLFTTGMIYRSLKPIPAWSTDWTVAAYLALGLLTGLAVLVTVAALFGLHPGRFQTLAIILVLAAAIIKNGYWSRLNSAWAEQVEKAGAAVASPGKTVHSVEWPHTEANYVLKEMGYRIARKHAESLRRYSRILLFAVPAVVFGVMPSLLPLSIFVWVVVPSLILTLVGVVLERWLFFAEAKHVVTLYYGVE
ncbi:MAG: DmsC/YnfH family molybdoenzyme membrane anchor subunit [Rhodospirillaceae bacterium]